MRKRRKWNSRSVYHDRLVLCISYKVSTRERSDILGKPFGIITAQAKGHTAKPGTDSPSENLFPLNKESFRWIWGIAKSWYHRTRRTYVMSIAHSSIQSHTIQTKSVYAEITVVEIRHYCKRDIQSSGAVVFSKLDLKSEYHQMCAVELPQLYHFLHTRGMVSMQTNACRLVCHVSRKHSKELLNWLVIKKLTLILDECKFNQTSLCKHSVKRWPINRSEESRSN